MLPLDVVAKIRRLYYAEHWKLGTIAEEIGVSWEAVRRAVHVVPPPRRSGVGASKLDPYLEFLRSTLDRHPRLRATRLFEMVRDRGYDGSVVQLRRAVARLRLPHKEAFLRLRTFPGEQAQVDWASFGTIRIGRAERKLSAFVVVLSWSRAIFLEFFLDQTLESFLLGHVHAFESFTGVPRSLLYDNLRSAVLDIHRDLRQFHPRLLELAAHYHFEPRACRPARGNEKGRVERAIQYVRHSFFAARRFHSLADLNRQAGLWRERIAHERAWVDDAGQSIAEAFTDERSRLLPLPIHPFETDLLRPVRSGKTPYVRFDRNDYSIPPELVGRSLSLLASPTTIRLLHATVEIARHERSWDSGAVVENPLHIKTLVETKRRAAGSAISNRLLAVGPEVEAFLAAALVAGESSAKTARDLLLLLEEHGAGPLRHALRIALERNTPRASSIAFLLDQSARAKRTRAPLPVALEGHPDLADLVIKPHEQDTYDELTRHHDDDEDGSD